MAQVGFKRGLESKLFQLALTAANDGTFYLTTDTNRLFVCNGSELKPVNQGIITVANVGALPQLTAENQKQYAGNFCYINDVNILAVASGTKWVQINSDTHLEESEEGLVLSNATGGVKVALSVADSAENTVTGEFELVGGKDIAVSQANGKITIASTVTATEYELKVAEGGKIQLSDGASNDEVTILPGSNVTSVVSNTKAGSITINVDDMNVGDFTAEATKTGFQFTIQNGTDAGNTEVATIEPSIKYGGSKQINFVDGIAELEVYDMDQINQMLLEAKQGMDAMTFRGTVGENGSIAESLDALVTANGDQIQIGDTYKIITDEDYDDQNFSIGDLAIAQGTENGTTGYITPESLYFVLVPSSGSLNTTYSAEGHTGGFSIKENADADGQEILDVTFKGDKIIDIVDENPTQPTKHIYINHKKSNVAAGTGDNQTQQAGQELVIPVEKVTYDEYGHITGVTTTEYTVVDTTTNLPDQLTKVEAKVADEDDGVKLDIIATLGENNTISTTNSESTVSLTSKSLKVSAVNNAIAVELEWGTF